MLCTSIRQRKIAIWSRSDFCTPPALLSASLTTIYSTLRINACVFVCVFCFKFCKNYRTDGHVHRVFRLSWIAVLVVVKSQSRCSPLPRGGSFFLNLCYLFVSTKTYVQRSGPAAEKLHTFAKARHHTWIRRRKKKKVETNLKLLPYISGINMTKKYCKCSCFH